MRKLQTPEARAKMLTLERQRQEQEVDKLVEIHQEYEILLAHTTGIAHSLVEKSMALAFDSDEPIDIEKLRSGLYWVKSLVESISDDSTTVTVKTIDPSKGTPLPPPPDDIEEFKWPWQRCKKREAAKDGSRYRPRCDRKRNHRGRCYVDRAFQSYWFGS